MKTRNELPQVLNSLGLIGEGAEIGVYKAHYAEKILHNWRGKKLYLVDPWKHQGRKLDLSDLPQREQDRIYAEARERMKKEKRACFIKDLSHFASLTFDDRKLDFVYIDACHDYRSVWSDLTDWYPKVKVGGIVAGHDYKNSCVRKNLVEVKRAVDNFFRMCGETILTTTEDNLPTWYVIKHAN